MRVDVSRRRYIALAGAAAVVGVAARSSKLSAAEHEEKEEEKEVLAVEDLMREHGILRRALLVYSETASRLLSGGEIPTDALGRTAALFRSFGEDYHERSLEEKHVFPLLIKSGGSHASLAKTLTDQHQRGRQITDYITAVARKGRVGSADAKPFANELSAFVRMYEHHAAIEDTVIFPAWKEAITGTQYRELSEQSFGLSDLNVLTAPPPTSA